MASLTQEKRSASETVPLTSRAVLWAVLGFAVWYLILGFFLDRDQPELRYFVTDWMVTYAGGFVRRGLLGQTFISLGDLTHIAPFAMIEAARAAIQLAFVALTVRLCLKNGQSLGWAGAVLTLANPLAAMYLWYFPGSFDLAFVLITAANLGLAKSRSESSYVVAATLLFSLAGVFIALSHEAILFLCLPVNLMISWRALSQSKFARISAIYVLCVAACLVAAKFHGTHEQVEAIRQGWTRQGTSLPYFNVLLYLPNGLGEQIRGVLSRFSPSSLLLWAASDALCLLPLAWFWKRAVAGSDVQTAAMLKRYRLDYFAIPFLATLPLYLLGDDWHRWLAIPVVTGLVCVLIEAPKVKFSVKSPAAFAALLILSLIVRPVALYTPKNALAGGALPSTAALLYRHVKQNRFGLR